jgi:two-component system sensor histidine kinase CpxA
MRSLFIKIFLWFWLTVVLMVSIVEIMTVASRANAEQMEWERAFVAAEAARAVDIYERQGAAALKEHLQHLPKRPLQGYLIDENGNEVLGQPLPKEAVQFAHKDFANEMAPGSGAEAVNPNQLPQLSEPRTGASSETRAPIPRVAPAAIRDDASSLVREQAVIGASGRHYTFLLVMFPFSLKTFFALFRPELALPFAAVLAIAAIFCFWLARHITAPVALLRGTANKIALGDFSARASSGMDKRKDEIGVLARHFDQMTERIEGLLGDHKRLLSTVSHELRSPLTRLSVAAVLLRQCPEEEKLEYVERIEQETEQLNKLIAQLLTLSRIESGVDSLAGRETIDLATLVQEVAANGDFEAQGRSRSVTVGVVDSCVTRGIVDQVRRAIENVVRNAIRHTKANSSVEITLRRGGTEGAGTALVQVRDHGPGVPDSDLDKIFLPFYRVTPGESNGDGSGLGLAITERIARTHGGSVRATNVPDGGLLVELELPLNA